MVAYESTANVMLEASGFIFRLQIARHYHYGSWIIIGNYLLTNRAREREKESEYNVYFSRVGSWNRNRRQRKMCARPTQVAISRFLSRVDCAHSTISLHGISSYSWMSLIIWYYTCYIHCTIFRKFAVEMRAEPFFHNLYEHGMTRKRKGAKRIVYNLTFFHFSLP